MIAHEGTTQGAGRRFVYVATDSAPGGLFYEIADAMEPARYAMRHTVAGAATTEGPGEAGGAVCARAADSRANRNRAVAPNENLC